MQNKEMHDKDVINIKHDNNLVVEQNRFYSSPET